MQAYVDRYINDSQYVKCVHTYCSKDSGLTWLQCSDELYIRIDEAYGDMDNAVTKAQSWSVVQLV